MDHELLEEVLSCPTLPSLPAVALEVIELTRDANVSMDRLAETIQNDQGLSAKVLRTVNSSYYGLRKKCGTIRQAIVVLGLSAVKSITLGFSLVSSIDMKGRDDFDHNDYWRRGLFTAVAARSIAKAASCEYQDEAFLGGLLQDVGVVALYESLGNRYVHVLEQTGGDHRKLCKFEIADLELQHPDIGAMMASRWKLPEELIQPVKYHERPSAGPGGEIGQLVRAVGLGNVVADALTAEDAQPILRRFYQKAKEWFDLNEEQCDAILEEVAKGTKEMAKLFDIKAGAVPDTDELIKEARDQALRLTIEAPAVEDSGETPEDLLLDSPRYDQETGLFNAESFGKVIGTLFEASGQGANPLTLVHIQFDREGDTTPIRPLQLRKMVAGITTLLRKHFGDSGGPIGRLESEHFAIAVPSNSRLVVTRTAEAFRQEFAQASEEWSIPGKLNVGIAYYDTSTAGAYQRVEQLSTAAARAMKASGSAGGNCVKVFTPKRAA
ncbi:MAG TPA: HDOD domain-containing protein [Phycisphaerales bacterium]|nr:HDOD domain-containing protein [Phycisphaerales bacterium]